MCSGYFELMRGIYFALIVKIIISLKWIQYFCSLFIMLYYFALYAD